MMEALPESLQNQVVEYLRDYIADMQDEMEWDAQFANSQDGLVATARRARQEIDAGKAVPMDYDQL